MAKDTVLSGPFAGTKLRLSPVSRRNLLGQLLGTYEIELRETIEQTVSKSYATIINLGAADGYYAIGLACRLSRATVIAYEANPAHHANLTISAQANGVAGRVHLRGLCKRNDMQGVVAAASKPALVICDIEGSEITLFDDEIVEVLHETDVLVETHEAFAPGCTGIIAARFAATHDVERFSARPRTLRDFPISALPWVARLLPKTAVELMSERRAEAQQWLFLRCRDA